MKPEVKIQLGLIFIAFFFYGNALKAQNPTLDAQWIVKTNNGTNLVLELGIRTNTPHEHLGPAQFIFNFDNTNYVKFNGGTIGAATSGTNFNWIDSFSPTIYTGPSTSVAQTSLGTINIQFNFSSGTGASISDSTAYTPVADIIFTVSDPSQSTDITWNMGESTPGTFDYVTDDNINNPTNFDSGSFNVLTVSPLPVTILNFTANLRNYETELTWSTASEINNAYFTIERSIDGFHFNSLMQVKGAGNSEINNNYTQYDSLPLQGVSYYRLSQTDFNGSCHIFNMVAINNAVNPIPTIEITNLGFGTGLVSMTYYQPDEGPLTTVVTDVNGKIIYSQQVATGRGIHTLVLSGSQAWKPGTYLIRLYSQTKFAIHKFVMP